MCWFSMVSVPVPGLNIQSVKKLFHSSTQSSIQELHFYLFSQCWFNTASIPQHPSSWVCLYLISNSGAQLLSFKDADLPWGWNTDFQRLLKLMNHPRGRTGPKPTGLHHEALKTAAKPPKWKPNTFHLCCQTAVHPWWSQTERQRPQNTSALFLKDFIRVHKATGAGCGRASAALHHTNLSSLSAAVKFSQVSLRGGGVGEESSGVCFTSGADGWMSGGQVAFVKIPVPMEADQSQVCVCARYEPPVFMAWLHLHTGRKVVTFQNKSESLLL